jgi:hypothetical protein
VSAAESHSNPDLDENRCSDSTRIQPANHGSEKSDPREQRETDDGAGTTSLPDRELIPEEEMPIDSH